MERSLDCLRNSKKASMSRRQSEAAHERRESHRDTGTRSCGDLHVMERNSDFILKVTILLKAFEHGHFMLKLPPGRFFLNRKPNSGFRC